MGAEPIRIKISKVVGRMLDAKYCLGGMSPEVGFDCLSYLYYFLEGIGAAPPSTSSDGEHAIGNYLEYFERDPREAKAVMWREIRKFLAPVQERNAFRPADVFVTHKRGEEPTTSVYVGAGNLLTCDVRVGIMVYPRRFLVCDRIEVLRCPKLYP